MSELLEREDLLASLVAALEEGGRLVFIGGEAGVGKTSLVRAFAALADPPVLRGSCENLTTPTPLGRSSTSESTFGKEFDEIKADNRYGIPASWAPHAWIWKPNPSGMLYAWNPRVDCGPGLGS